LPPDFYSFQKKVKSASVNSQPIKGYFLLQHVPGLFMQTALKATLPVILRKIKAAVFVF
jgi:hypothetical protein